MSAPLSAEQLEALRRLDASTLANAIESFQERLRNEGFADGSVHCLFPHLAPVVGYAVTVKIRGSAPPGGRDNLHGPDRLVGLYRFGARTADGGGAGYRHQTRARLVAR